MWGQLGYDWMLNHSISSRAGTLQRWQNICQGIAVVPGAACSQSCPSACNIVLVCS